MSLINFDKGLLPNSSGFAYPPYSNRYISSFLGFAPADDPVILGVCIIYNPQGIYYGGTIAAPVMKTIFETVLPYLGIDKTAVVTEESKTE